MMAAHSEVENMPVTLRNWTTQSGRAFKPRSAALIDVDNAVAAYRRAPSAISLKALANWLLRWMDSKPGWYHSMRYPEVRELVNLVKAEAAHHHWAGGNYIFSYCMAERAVPALANGLRTFLTNHTFITAGQPDGVRNGELLFRRSDDIFGYDDLLLRPTSHGGASYYMQAAGTNRGPTVTAVYVAMHQDVTPVTDRMNIEGRFIPLVGSNFMMTGMLSGCCFMIRKVAGQVQCTHIQPLAPTWADGGQLQTYLESLGMNGVTFYGRNDYGYGPNPGVDASMKVTICGRLHPSGRWHIYAQRFMNSDFTRLDVQEIYVG